MFNLRQFLRYFCFLLIASCLPLTLLSEVVKAQDDLVLPEVDIRGTVRREELQTTSAAILENKDVVDRVVYEPADLFRRVPGIKVGFFGEGGQGPQMVVRGFIGLRPQSDVGVYMDGIPLWDNGHSAGFIDTGMIMPIEIESIEVIKGPSSVYYGQHSAGASIPFQSIKGGNQTKLKIRYGSYNDATVTGLIARESEKFAQVYAFELYHGDGFRQNSEWNRKNFSGRWTYKVTDDLSLSLNLRAYQTEWNSAGFISYMRHPYNRYAAADDGTGNLNGGDRDRYDARLWANYYLNDESQLTFYIYGTDFRNRRFQMSEPLITVTNPVWIHTGSEQNNNHKSWGMGLSYNYKGLLFGRTTAATLGASYAYEREGPRKNYRIRWGTGRARYEVINNETFDISSPSFFGEISYQILDQLNIRIGARYDILQGDYLNELAANPQTTKSPRHKIFQPKAGILYSPFNWLQIYANFGRGYTNPGLNVNSAASFYSPNSFGLSIRDQFELGTRMSPFDWLDIEIALFRVNTDKDVTWDEILQTNLPIGETVRQGIEFSTTLRPIDNWNLNFNYTLNDAKRKVYLSTIGGHVYDFRDKWIEQVPKHMTFVELAYTPPQGFGGRVSFQWESHAYARDQPAFAIDGTPNPYGSRNKVKLQDTGSLDVQLFYRINDNYKISLDILNALDKFYWGGGTSDYATSTGDFTYTVRMPRTFYVSLDLDF
jgi:iron complex outermembrane receptor protein